MDFVKEAGQKYWQILPLGPTGYGDSPYQSFSAFAGNPYFISPDALVEEGLLTEEEAAGAVYGGPASSISYEWLYQTRFILLRKAYQRWKKQKKQGEHPGGDAVSGAGAGSGTGTGDAASMSYEAFLKENESWLPDYALFMALKEAHGGAGFRDWEEPVRMRRPEALKKARQDLADEIGFHLFLQYTFERQWMALKAYANRKGISIIGDIPIYVPADSAEVWAYPELFQLREDGTCKAVAGCPPDGFSATGQLWGNPLYDWEHHARTGYAWWINRMARCRSLVDIVRIDHFRGFDQYYAIPAESEDARVGQWEDGPGIALFNAVEKEIPGLTIIAEDLGYITDSVRQLVRDTGYPNMKVLEFAFDSRDSSGKDNYLPFHYEKNCVVYTGTHDNETLVGWLDNILPVEREQVRAFVGLDGRDGDAWAYDACAAGAPAADVPAGAAPAPKKVEESSVDTSAETLRLARAMVRAAMASVGDMCVIPMQDWLLLDNRARINTPSTTGTNWCWRMREGAASPELAEQIRRMTETYGR